MKLYFMLTTIAATAASANAHGKVTVTVKTAEGVVEECFDTIHTSETIGDWYQYGDPDVASANTGLEDSNSGWIG